MEGAENGAKRLWNGYIDEKLENVLESCREKNMERRQFVDFQ